MSERDARGRFARGNTLGGGNVPRTGPKAKKELTDKDYPLLAVLGNRLGVREAAARLGMGESTLRRILEDDERAALAWEVGRAELMEEAVGVLVEEMRNKKSAKRLTAAFGILNGFFGFRNPQDHHVQASLSIKLRAPMTPEEYLKAVSIDVTPEADGDA